MSVTDKADHESVIQPSLFDDPTVTTPTDGAPAEATTLLDRALNGDEEATTSLLVDVQVGDTTDSQTEDALKDESLPANGQWVRPTVVRERPSPNPEAENPRRRRVIRGAILAGAVVVAGVLGTGISGMLSPGDPVEQSDTSLVINGDINTETTLDASATTLTPETTVGTVTTGEFGPDNVDGDKTTGIIHTARLIRGEPFNQAQRPNGELINVPEVRAGSPDQYAIMESAGANLAAYITTENPIFLKALTSAGVGSETRLSETLAQDVLKDKAKINSPGFQASIYDDPEDPVKVSRSLATDGTTMISLDGGSLYLVVTVDDAGSHDTWQAPSTHVDPEIVNKGALTRVYKINTFQVFISEQPDGTRITNNTYLDYELVTP